jgi:hypothetical protein
VERSSTLTTPEVVGIATAAAAALGGVVVALGRSQAAAARARSDNGLEAAVHRAATPPAAAAERGKELAKLVSSLVSTRYPELRQEVEAVVQRAAASSPSPRRVAHSAAERAEHARTTSTEALGRVQQTVVPAATGALHGLRERAAEARHRTQPAASAVVSRSAEKADLALAKSSSAARETVAVVGWLVAATALIYIALLTPERREQVRAFVVTGFEQVRLLIRDFQGYEEEY